MKLLILLTMDEILFLRNILEMVVQGKKDVEFKFICVLQLKISEDSANMQLMLL